jgi:methionyl-tRNA formyltransferase
MSLRIIFMGTPAFAATTLKALHDAGHLIVCVYSQPPRPGGRRGLELVKSPVHQMAEQLGLEVRTPLNFKQAEDVDAFKLMARGWGPSTAMHHCCRAGAARRRSSGRSWRAIPKPA